MPRTYRGRNDEMRSCVLGSQDGFRVVTTTTILGYRNCPVAILLIPRHSHGQFSSFGVIAGATSSVIGGGLDAVTEIMAVIEEFQRTVVWPEDLIAPFLSRGRGRMWRMLAAMIRQEARGPSFDFVPFRSLSRETRL